MIFGQLISNCFFSRTGSILVLGAGGGPSFDSCGRTRVEPDEAELLLKSGELILCIVGLYHLLEGWKGHGSPINLSDVRLIRPA
jgi:hypothetical protein